MKFSPAGSCSQDLIYLCTFTDLFCRYRVFCLVGDGESAEGSVWEALHFASHYELDNLVAIIDINRLGQSEATSLQHRMDIYEQRLKSFG